MSTTYQFWPPVPGMTMLAALRLRFGPPNSLAVPR